MDKELLKKAWEAGWSSREPIFDGGWKTTKTFDEWYNESVLPQANVSGLVVLAKKNYKSKDGIIKEGIFINGKWYAPHNDI